MNGANSHVLSSLVWFREHPSPRPLLVLLNWKPSSWIFFSYAGESTSPLYNTWIWIPIWVSIKQNEKPGWKHNTKGERKSRKGGRSLVLVLTDTSLSNFHFWVLSLFSYLFGLNERKKKLPFLSLLFIPSTNFGYDQCPTSWIGVRKLPEKRQGAPWIELDELHFARDLFLVRKILYWKFKIKKIKKIKGLP